MKIRSAIIDYTKAIDINPESAKIYYLRSSYYFQYYRGNALDELGWNEDSINNYTKAININPQNAQTC